MKHNKITKSVSDISRQLSNLTAHKYFVPVTLVLILLLASVLRLHALGSNPVGLNQDEAVNGYDAYSLGMTLKDHHGNFLPLMLESFGDWASSLLTYITVPFVMIFGLSETAIRLPVAVMGIATVALTYFYIKRISNGRRDFALLAAFVLCLTPWHITLSRWAIPPSIVPFFLLILLLCLDHLRSAILTVSTSAKRRRLKILSWILASSVAAFLLTMAYPTQKIFIPLLLAAYCLIFLNLRKHWKQIVIFAVSFSVLFLPLFLPSVLEPEKYNARFSSVSLSQAPEGVVGGFASRFVQYFQPKYLFAQGDPDNMHRVPNYGSHFEYMTLFFYIGLLAAAAAVLRRKDLLGTHSKTLLFWLSLLILSAIPASVTFDRMHLLRHVHGLMFVIFLTSVGLIYLVQDLTRVKRLFILITFALIGIYYLVSFSNYYFGDYRTLSKDPFQYGVAETMLYLQENEGKFTDIKIDHDITQAYIYYLFYFEVPPGTLDYSQINYSSRNGDNWTHMPRYNQYQFGEITDADLAGKKLIHEVKDTDGVYFKIYSDGDFNWVVDRV